MVALLLVYLGAAPAQSQQPYPVEPYEIGAGIAAPWQQTVYYPYDSVGFWLDELVWHSSLYDEPNGDSAAVGMGDDYITWYDEKYDWAAIAAIYDEEPPSKYPIGTVQHVLSRWVEYGLSKYLDWGSFDADRREELFYRWLRGYTTPLDNNSQGGEGEFLIDAAEKFTAQGYEHDATFRDGSLKRFDFFLRDASGKIVHIVEVKSGDWTKKQIRSRLDLALEEGTPLVSFYFLARQTPKQIETLQALFAEAKYAGITVETFELPAVGEPRPHPNRNYPPDDESGSATGGGVPSGPPPPLPGALASEGDYAADNPSVDAIAQSPSSEEEAAVNDATAQGLAEERGFESAEDADMATDPLGGVDFSTLELRYVSDTYDGGLGSGVDYAYQVDPAEGVEVSYGGQESAQLASDSFFTWLALHPSSFTVNLNPDEPDRIIDAEFGRTDAGRVLLEADLQMKKSVADFIHPDSDLGAQYWEALQGETKCISMRQWIVPKPAVVHENDDELFILDAPLEVKMETEYLETAGVGGVGGCTGQSESDTQANEQIYRDMILPELEEAINTAPEYADLRRVYASRVAAEWFRDRSLTHATAFSDVIDSGDASAWYSRTPWDPEEVFDRYVQSYTEGEFEVEHTTQEGNYLVTYVYVYGGVNFSDVPEDELGAEAFDAEHPELDAAVEQALLGPASEEGANLVWLGGQTTQRPPWDPFPQPASPLSNPWFYVLTGLPVFAWLAFGGYLTWRRPRRAKGSVAA